MTVFDTFAILLPSSVLYSSGSNRKVIEEYLIKNLYYSQDKTTTVLTVSETLTLTINPRLEDFSNLLVVGSGVFLLF